MSILYTKRTSCVIRYTPSVYDGSVHERQKTIIQLTTENLMFVTGRFSLWFLKVCMGLYNLQYYNI